MAAAVTSVVIAFGFTTEASLFRPKRKGAAPEDNEHAQRVRGRRHPSAVFSCVACREEYSGVEHDRHSQGDGH